MILLALAVAACSQPSGVEQVDRARDGVKAALGVGTDLDAVGDAATRAVREAEAAGRTGNPADMAGAVGRGTGSVLCAGAGVRKPAARQTLRTIQDRAPAIEGKDAATALLRNVVEAMPDVPNPCR